MKVSPRTLKLMAAGAAITAVALYADAAAKTANCVAPTQNQVPLTWKISQWWYEFQVRRGWIAPGCVGACGMG